jgi:hypothetical protein
MNPLEIIETIESYSAFANTCEQAVRMDDVDTMKWIGLARIKQCIEYEMYQLVYYMERAKINPDCIPLREMHRLSILNHITDLKKTIHDLQFKY